MDLVLSRKNTAHIYVVRVHRHRRQEYYGTGTAQGADRAKDPQVRTRAMKYDPTIRGPPLVPDAEIGQDAVGSISGVVMSEQPPSYLTRLDPSGFFNESAASDSRAPKDLDSDVNRGLSMRSTTASVGFSRNDDISMLC